jgi:hypothetical protein
MPIRTNKKYGSVDNVKLLTHSSWARLGLSQTFSFQQNIYSILQPATIYFNEVMNIDLYTRLCKMVTNGLTESQIQSLPFWGSIL